MKDKLHPDAVRHLESLKRQFDCAGPWVRREFAIYAWNNSDLFTQAEATEKGEGTNG